MNPIELSRQTQRSGLWGTGCSPMATGDVVALLKDGDNCRLTCRFDADRAPTTQDAFTPIKSQ